MLMVYWMELISIKERKNMNNILFLTDIEDMKISNFTFIFHCIFIIFKEFRDSNLIFISCTRN